jgi:hypothetical protein
MVSFSPVRGCKGWPKGEEDEIIGSKKKLVPMIDVFYMAKPVKAILSPMEPTKPKKEKSPVAFGVKAVEGLFVIERAPSSMTSVLPKNGF